MPNIKVNTPVDLPEKVIIDHNKKTVYFKIDHHYDSNKKYTVDKRLYIGKINNDNKLIPNNNYFQLFEPTKLDEAPLRCDSISIGSYAFINKASILSGIDDSLNCFEECDKNLILDLAYYMICEQSAVFQHYPSFGYSHHVFSNNVKSDSFISRFLTSDVITESTIDIFLNNWSKYNNKKTIYLTYDSTNINYVGDGVTLAEMGHAKDDETKPQINIEYVVRLDNGIPIMYETYPGSIIDMVEFTKMSSRLKDNDYKNITLICDRGYISLENIKWLDNHNYDFILMLKNNLIDSKRIINEHFNEVKYNNEYYLNDYDIYVKSFMDKIYNIDKARYFHLIFNPDIMDTERKNLLNTVNKYEIEIGKYIENKLSISKNEENKLSRYFEIKTNKQQKVLSYKKRNDVINDEVSKLGYYVIVTSKPISSATVIELYKGRDNVEKDFRSLKSSLGLSSFKVHSDRAIISKVFISFIACILRCYIFNEMKELRKQNKKDFTINASLDEIDKVHAIYNYKNNKYALKYALTSKQKNILKTLNIDEKYLINIANNMTR